VKKIVIDWEDGYSDDWVVKVFLYLYVIYGSMCIYVFVYICIDIYRIIYVYMDECIYIYILMIMCIYMCTYEYLHKYLYASLYVIGAYGVKMHTETYIYYSTRPE
jgi:hypothetical protein